MRPACRVVYSRNKTNSLGNKTNSLGIACENARENMLMSELLEPAQNLNNVYKTLSPNPLKSSKQQAAFYIGDLNNVRVGDKIQRIKRK